MTTAVDGALVRKMVDLETDYKPAARVKLAAELDRDGFVPAGIAITLDDFVSTWLSKREKQGCWCSRVAPSVACEPAT